MLSDSLPLFSYRGAANESPLDARVKLIAAAALIVGIVLGRDVRQFVALALFLAAMIALGRLPLRILGRSLRPIVGFVLIGGVLTAITTPGRGYAWGPIHVSHAGLGLATRVSVQLVLLLTVTLLLTYTTSPFALAGALRRLLGFLERLRVPVEDMATMLTIAITFFPIMSREVDRTLTARAARGANVHRLGVFTMLGDMLEPLIASNLRRGEELAMALETRLYGYAHRSHREDRPMDRRSVAFLGIVVAFVVATVVAL